MTDQEIFDAVVAHLLAQNVQALSTTTHERLYRAPDGRRCAVGCLIPDDVYNPEMEGVGVANLPQKYPALSWMVPHDYLLNWLQSVHDNHPPADWPRQLRIVAEEHQLELPPVLVA